MHMCHQLPASDKPLKWVGGPQLCAIAGLLSGGTQINTVFQVPLSILGKPMNGLVDYLVQEYDDNMSRVRVLYRWLTNQPISRMKILNKEPKEKRSALHHLWLLLNKRERYSTVFSNMCR